MSQNIQSVVPDDLAERVRRAAEKEGRSVSQWLRLVVERKLAGVCVGCDGTVWDGGEVCEDCAALMDAEDAEDLPAHPRMVGDTKLAIKVRKAQPSRGIVRGEPVMCAHDEVEKRTTPALGTRRFCKDCGALLP